MANDGTKQADLKKAKDDADAAVDALEIKDVDATVISDYNAAVTADTGLAGSTTAAAAEALIKDKKNLFVMSHVTILKAAKEGDPETSTGGARWEAYETLLVDQKKLWDDLIKNDVAADDATDDAKTAATARKAAYELGTKAYEDWKTFVTGAKDAKKATEADATQTTKPIPEASAFDVARTQYVEAYLGSLKALSTQLATEDAYKTDKDALKLYSEFMGAEMVVAKAKAEAAQAAAEGGGMGWLWGLLAGVGALVGGYFAYKKCKGGDEKEE